MEQNLQFHSQAPQITSPDYKAIFNCGPALVVLPDAPTFTVVNVSGALSELLKCNAQQLLGKGFFEFFSNTTHIIIRNASVVRNTFLNFVKDKKTAQIPLVRYEVYEESSLSYRSGYWTIKFTPVTHDNSDLSFIVLNLVDVTEVINLAENERAAHETVEDQRKQLYSLFMQAPVAIGIFIGPDCVVELANPTLCNLLGRSEDELYGHSIFEVMPEPSGINIKENLNKVLQTGDPFIGKEQHIPVIRKGKSQIVYFNFVFEPLRELDGRITGVIAVATEVTDQVNYRKKLEESEHRVNMALAASNLGVWDVEITSGILNQNRRFDEIFGYKESGLIWNFERIIEHVLPDDQERTKRIINKALTRTGKLNLQARIKCHDGNLRWVHSIGKVYFNENNQPVRMLGTIQDVTERKEKERHKDEFISAVSHELKTPVTSLKAFCQVLQRKFVQAENATASEMLAKMNTQINRLNVVIQDLLDVTRIEGDKLQYRHATFFFNELLKEIIEEVQRTTDTHTIIFDEKVDQVKVYGDRERIGQVITNLLTNAVRYSPGKDLIITTLSKKNQDIICSIKDFGIGIPKEKHQSIFERFYRVRENDPAAGAGLGLGLYICYEIIKRQNGHIWLESEPNKGSTFYFSLPV